MNLACSLPLLLGITVVACGSPSGSTSTGGTGGAAGSTTTSTGGAAGSTTTSTGGAAGSTTTSTGGSTTGGAGGALGDPTFAAECASNQGVWTPIQSNGGAVEFGVPDPGADDNAVCKLLFPGDPALGSGDHVSPGFATEIDSVPSFGYGMYRTRISLASCAASEEVVNGIFVYQNDGLDHDGDGLTDNAEIDIEILCGEPNIVFLTSWTDYDDATGEFRKWTRAVDMATGDISESPSNHEYGLVPAGSSPALKHPGFPAPSTFYEMGFEWHEGRIRWFIVLDGQEVTLWDFQDATLVPPAPAPFLFNVWHSAEHWYSGGAADYPASDAVMKIDWLRYWAETP